MWHSTVIAVAGFCGVLLVLKLTFPYLAPFFIGLLFSVFLDGPVGFLQTRGWPRSAAAALLVAVVFLTLPFLLSVLLVQLYREIQALWLSGVFESFPGLIAQLPLEEASITSGDLVTLITRMAKSLLAIPDLVVLWLIAAMSAYFFCRDKRLLARFIVSLLPISWQEGFFQLYRDSVKALGQLLKVQLLLVFAVGMISTVSFYVLGLAYPLLSGFLVAFFDLVPVLGPGLVFFTLAALQVWLGNIPRALALGLTYLVLLLVRQLFEAQLVGERLGLHPLTALVAVYVGWRFWGLMGALVGPLLMVVMRGLVAVNKRQ